MPKYPPKVPAVGDFVHEKQPPRMLGAKDWELSSTRALDWFYNAIRTLGAAGWWFHHIGW